MNRQQIETMTIVAEGKADHTDNLKARMDGLEGSDDYETGRGIAERAAMMANQNYAALCSGMEHATATDAQIRRLADSAARAAGNASDLLAILKANAEAIESMYEAEEPAPSQGDWTR